jgi:dipeptidase
MLRSLNNFIKKKMHEAHIKEWWWYYRAMEELSDKISEEKRDALDKVKKEAVDREKEIRSWIRSELEAVLKDHRIVFVQKSIDEI